MRRRLAFLVLIVLFGGGALLWEHVLATPTRQVFLVLGEVARARDALRLEWRLEHGGRELARGVVHARGGRLPARELLGSLPLKRGAHLLRVGVFRPFDGPRPSLERSLPVEVDDGEVVLVSLEGDEP